MRIQIINGPNINLLGNREPSIYGSVTFEEYLAELRKKYPDVELGYFQSNVEPKDFKSFVSTIPPFEHPFKESGKRDSNSRP